MTSKRKKYTKKCSHPHCTNNSVQANLCRRHGAPTKRCNEPTCNNVPVKGGVCQRHGAKKKTCSYPSCTNICQKWGVCRKHGAEPTRCSQANCSNKAVNGGVCCRHGAKLKKCNYANCPNLSAKGGFCRRHIKKITDSNQQVALSNEVCHSSHDLCTRTTYILPEQRSNGSQNKSNFSHVKVSSYQRTESQKCKNSEENEKIDVDTILQVPHYVSDNFRKVGFAKCANGYLFPVLFLGPNDAPSYIRREWQARLNQHLRQGTRMAHLVVFYGQELEIDKFGLVYDVYLYDEYLEEVFLANPKRELQAKMIQQGETLDPRDLNFNLAILELALARSLPEEYRWLWEPSPFFP